MKNILIVVLFLSTTLAFCQETDKKSIFDRKHEVKIGAVKLLSGTILEGTYEYIQSKDFTYGTSLLVNLDSKSEYPEDFSITPFARFYFQESKEYGAKGFFVEGFGKYTSGKNYSDNYSGYFDQNGNYITNEYRAKFNAASIGLALGKKWINSSGFVFELLVGASRTLGNSEQIPDALFRGDLNIGYRF